MKNRGLMIAIVVLLLCCCCLVFAGVGWQYGDAVMQYLKGSGTL